MRVEYQKESSYHVFVQGKRRKRHVEAQSAEEKEKKRESIQIHTQERTCVLCSIVIPLNLPFIKRKKKKHFRRGKGYQIISTTHNGSAILFL